MINSNLTFIFRYYIASIYSLDLYVLELVAKAMEYISYFFLFVDPYQGTLAGVLRGIEKQAAGAAINLIAFYLFGLPIAFVSVLIFNLKIFGAWLGLFVGEGIIMIGYLILIFRTNWVQASLKAQKIAISSSLSSVNLLNHSEIKINEEELSSNFSSSNFEDHQEN